MIFMRLNVRNAILLSGALWLGIGIFLLTKGIYLFVYGVNAAGGAQKEFPLIKKITEYTKDPRQAVLILACSALFIGFFKGRMILKKSVRRVVGRICSLPSPLSIKNLYSKGYLALVAGMMGMGMLQSYL